MMNIGDRVRLEIIDTNENGVGIAKCDSAVVFVPQTVDGDIVEAEIISKKKNYLTAVCVEYCEYSDKRVHDLCLSGEFSESAISGVIDNRSCGGCSLGHVTYEYENLIKKNTVRSAFRRAGLDMSVISDTVYSDMRERYRNKITLHYSNGVFGYYAEGSRVSSEFRDCLLCPVEFSKIVKTVNDNIDLISSAEPKELVLRSSRVGLITMSLYTKTNLIGEKEYRAKLLTLYPKLESVNFITADTNQTSYIYDVVGELKMRFSSEAFRQVNTVVFEKILESICSIAESKGLCNGADLYCGSGIIGLTLAKRFPDASLKAIEINSDAIADAEYNAVNNGICNIQFFCGDAATFKERIGECDPYSLPDFITVDPPRAGMSEKMRMDLLSLSPDTLIYVSCNPQTLARDLAEIVQNGYTIEKAVPYNLFPRTSHVETLCLLSKNH